MNNIFSMDNAFFRFVGKVTDLVWLNILTLICCIPIFTMGAAFTAMYHVLIKIAIKEEGVVTRPFFREFKANFKNGVLIINMQKKALASPKRIARFLKKYSKK